MAKGNRKRVAKKPKNQSTRPSDPLPLVQPEADMFQQLIQASNIYGKLRKQKEGYEHVLQELKIKKKRIKKGEIKPPFLKPLGNKTFYHETDVDKMLKDLDKEIKSIQNAIEGIKGQVEHRKDNYIDEALKIVTYYNKKFNKYKMKEVTGVRGGSTKEQEEKLFEASFDELMKDKKLQKEFNKAKQKAIEENKKRGK
ncbi:MAG: hypothetical protein ACOC80_13820 [Petrotogales bacterium]